MENKKDSSKKCTACREETEFLGQFPVRVGGSVGAAKFFFGEFAELGEGMLPIDMYRCKKCGHLELYDLDFSLPK